MAPHHILSVGGIPGIEDLNKEWKTKHEREHSS